jgi:hypothetical protein
MTTDTDVQFDLFEDDNHRPLGAHIWRKEANGFYVEPGWCSNRLFAAERFTGTIWPPSLS